MKRFHVKAIGVLVALAGVAVALQSVAEEVKAPSAIDNAMFFQSEVHDAADCHLSVDDHGKFSFADGAPSRPASCPDATAWKVLLEGIKGEFWVRWAFDAYTFPAKPLPLCGTEGADPSACCDPAAETNHGYDQDDRALHCPYYPGDHVNDAGQVLKPITSPPGSFQAGHGNPVAHVGPSRTMRQQSAEIVYRNKPDFQYIFDNGLYSQNGLARAFAKAHESATKYAPYRLMGSSIEFPTDSVVFKADWLEEDHMFELGLIQSTDDQGRKLDPPQDVRHPFITMKIDQSVGDNNAATFKPGLYYLLGFAITSKVMPDWLWASFEHVDLPGRCDFNGCNDSFGYLNADTPEGTYQNFVRPHSIPDELYGGFEIFEPAEPYPAGVLTPELAAIYDKLGFNQVKDPDPNIPSSNDVGWKSYRLKGTQTQFTTAEGFPTLMGNVVSEGGFVNSSSCMTCHTQASVAANGKMGLTGAGFSVRLNRLGYRMSANGAPDLNMFYAPGTATPNVVRTDYMWGTLFANPEIGPHELEKTSGSQ